MNFFLRITEKTKLFCKIKININIFSFNYKFNFLLQALWIVCSNPLAIRMNRYVLLSKKHWFEHVNAGQMTRSNWYTITDKKWRNWANNKLPFYFGKWNDSDIEWDRMTNFSFLQCNWSICRWTKRWIKREKFKSCYRNVCDGDD